MGWSTHRVQQEAAKYRRLRTDLPKTCGLWRRGLIDGYIAGKVVEAADRLTKLESIAVLDDETAQRAATDTPTQLSRWLSRRVARLEPDQAERRHRRARTMDQRRADLARDLLLGNTPGGRGSSSGIGVVVPVQSLLGVDDTPGELADRSASVPAPLAREIAARPGTLFYRLLTDERGNLLDVTQLGGFPSRLLGLAIDVRDGTCIWSTCTTAATKGDHHRRRSGRIHAVAAQSKPVLVPLAPPAPLHPHMQQES